MLNGMSLRLFYEWMEFYNRYSFGDELANLRQAITSTVIAKVHGNKTAKSEHFMPTIRKSSSMKQSFESMGAMMSTLAPVPDKK